jgi:hypothetical protein
MTPPPQPGEEEPVPEVEEPEMVAAIDDRQMGLF